MNVAQYGQIPMNGNVNYANGNAADYKPRMGNKYKYDEEEKIAAGEGEGDSGDKDGKPRKENEDDESDPQFEPEGGENEEDGKNDADAVAAGQATGPDGNPEQQLGNIK